MFSIRDAWYLVTSCSNWQLDEGESYQFIKFKDSRKAQNSVLELCCMILPQIVNVLIEDTPTSTYNLKGLFGGFAPIANSMPGSIFSIVL
jgi:hypothetical protein